MERQEAMALDGLRYAPRLRGGSTTSGDAAGLWRIGFRRDERRAQAWLSLQKRCEWPGLAWKQSNRAPTPH